MCTKYSVAYAGDVIRETDSSVPITSKQYWRYFIFNNMHSGAQIFLILQRLLLILYSHPACTSLYMVFQRKFQCQRKILWKELWWHTLNKRDFCLAAFHLPVTRLPHIIKAQYSPLL